MVKVVLADDEEFVRLFLKTVLATLHFDIVAEVEKGDELITTMNRYQPDILLLDINMPNLTGLEFLKEHAPKFSNTCIIILTSSASAKIKLDVITAGVNCFIRKDMHPQEMVESISNTWLEFRKRNN